MANLPIPESYWVEENRFLAGEFPGSYNPETTRSRMDAFLDAGIDTFIDLTQAHELASYESILKEQARTCKIDPSYHRFAIHDHDIPSHEIMTAILDTIDETLQKGSGVYVHCWGGVGRTGTVVGCYLVRHGHTPQQAIERVHTLFRTRPQNYFATSPETPQQFEFIRSWREIPDTGHRPRHNYCEG